MGKLEAAYPFVVSILPTSSNPPDHLTEPVQDVKGRAGKSSMPLYRINIADASEILSIRLPLRHSLKFEQSP